MSLWKWLDRLLCEHDWLNKAEFSIHRKRPDGEEVETGRIYVKECKKCHQIWKQRV